MGWLSTGNGHGFAPGTGVVKGPPAAACAKGPASGGQPFRSKNATEDTSNPGLAVAPADEPRWFGLAGGMQAWCSTPRGEGREHKGGTEHKTEASKARAPTRRLRHG